MLLKQFILFSTLLLPQCIVWAATGSIAQVVARLNALEDDADEGDSDVQGINAVTGATEPSVKRILLERNGSHCLTQIHQKIANDIQVVTTALDDLMENNQGVAATSDNDLEEQVTDGFEDVSATQPAA